MFWLVFRASLLRLTLSSNFPVTSLLLLWENPPVIFALGICWFKRRSTALTGLIFATPSGSYKRYCTD